MQKVARQTVLIQKMEELAGHMRLWGFISDADRLEFASRLSEVITLIGQAHSEDDLVTERALKLIVEIQSDYLNDIAQCFEDHLKDIA